MTDETTGLADIMHAVGVLQCEQTAAARATLMDLWQSWSTGNGALQAATIAHFLADFAETLEDEIAWDLRSLEAATGSVNVGACPPRTAALAEFLPSILLNVGDGYRRLGDFASAHRHAAAGLAGIDALQHGGYRETVTRGLERLLARTAGRHRSMPARGRM